MAIMARRLMTIEAEERTRLTFIEPAAMVYKTDSSIDDVLWPLFTSLSGESFLQPPCFCHVSWQ